MKRVKPKPLTEAYLRKITAYYENQPKDEALADVERLFSKEAIIVPATRRRALAVRQVAVAKVSETRAGYAASKPAAKKASGSRRFQRFRARFLRARPKKTLEPTQSTRWKS